MKLLVILSAVLSVHTVLAVPLSILLNNDHKTPSLVVDQPVYSQPVFIESDFDKNSKTKLSLSLSTLVQYKVIEQFINESSQLNILINELSFALVHIRTNAIYSQYFQQQTDVYNASQARQNARFQGQASYQAERQKIA